MSSVRKITISFVVWRLALFLVVTIGMTLLPFRSGNDFTRIASNSFLAPWANFDGVHYLDIARQGYTYDGRFFPLFPMLIHFFSAPFGTSGYLFWGFLLSNAFFLIALIIVYRLLRLDYPKHISQWTLIYLLIFPTAFFFTSVYAESLFLLLLVSSFYLLRKKHYLASCITAALLAITRPVGIVMLPVIAYELFKERKWKGVSLKNVLSLALVPIPLVLYAFYNLKKWGDALYFVHSQGTLNNSRVAGSIVLFPQTIYRYLKILATFSTHQYEWWIAVLEFVTFFFVSWLLYQAYRKKVRFSYLIFALLAFLIPTQTGTFTGLPRYVLILFPIYIALSLTESKLLRYLYIGISCILLTVLLIFFSRGYYLA